MVTLLNGVPRQPKRFIFVLMDQFTMLSFAGAVDALRIANRLGGGNLYTIKYAGEGGDCVTSSSNTRTMPCGPGTIDSLPLITSTMGCAVII